MPRKKLSRPKAKRKAPKKKQARDYSHFGVVSVSLYRPDIEKLDALLSQAREKASTEGRSIPNRSDLIRLAVAKLTEKDLSRL